MTVFRGKFDVELDFGIETDETQPAWLEFEVARSDNFGGYTLLEPRQQALEALPEKALSVPTGAVVFFNLAACPSGWTEHTAARGRTIVGVPAGGTLNGTVNSALSNLQIRMHSHQVFGDTLTTNAVDTHKHIWSQIQSAGGTVQWQSFASNGTWDLMFAWENGVGNEGSGTYPLAATPNKTLYTSKSGSHSHGVTVPAKATSASNAGFPYLQLLACRKE